MNHSSNKGLVNSVRNAFLSVKIRLWDRTLKMKICKQKPDHHGGSTESAQWERCSPFVKINYVGASADEKIRSLGHHKHHDVKTNVKTHKEHESNTETTLKQQNEKTSQQEKHGEDVDMAERKIYRQGRKEIQGSNEMANLEKSSIKHRSRSEGPAGRLKPKNSMEERKKISEQDKYKTSSLPSSGQEKYKSSSLSTSQSLRHSLCTDPQSDNETIPQDSSSDGADSDTNRPKKWVKNPLMLKKKQKADKRKSIHNGETGSVGNKENDLKPEVPSRKSINRSPQLSSRDGYIYQEKSNGQKAKYQKLEERRNKRVDMTVTSDEELNSPEIRISRLRQRALQEAKISTKLPDYLDESIYKQTDQNTYQSARTSQQPPVENGSSSSEQITLKPIGPSQRDLDNYRQWEYENNNMNARTQNLPPSFGNYGNKPVPPPRNIQGQGYRKIPKQEVDYTGNVNYRTGSDENRQFYVPNEVRGQSNVVRQQNMNFDPRNQAQVMRTRSNPSYKLQEGHSDNEISFQDVKTKEPVLMKKAIGRVEKKRKSHSDDDSLDELIESNIQYLESEIESGRLKKMTSNQPGMFPTSGGDVKRTSDKEKRRSASLDSVSRPVHQSSYQNEVKLRLQVPYVSRPNYRQHQYESYDNRADSNPKVTQQHSQSVVRPHEILYQNTVPVERRFQSATHSPYMQRRSELFNMEDMSKSDSQLNTTDLGLDYRRLVNYKNQQLQQNNLRPPFLSHDANIASEQDTVMKSLSVPGMESGMFSDVDYDIEVSERVKKWENLMKLKTDDPGGDKKPPVSLTTILESEGGVPDAWLPGQQVSPSVAVSSVTVTVTKSTTHMEPPPEPQPKVLSAETGSHRVFRVVQQPDSHVVDKPSESSVTYIGHVPSNSRPVNQEQQDQLYPDNYNQDHHLSDNSSYDNSSYDNSDMVTAVKQTWPPSEQEMSKKDQQKLARLSKYEEELSEIQVLKMDSVKDLRKRFDSDASGNESTDTREVITPVRLTPLRKRRHLIKSFEPSPSPPQPTKEEFKKPLKPKVREIDPPELIDVSAISSGVEPQNEEMWSPKLESSQGLVSIERVTARTLQTIPFSEDPIWKQIEEMTSFDQLLADEALNLQNSTQQDNVMTAHLQHRNSYIDIPGPAYSQTTTTTTTTAIYTPSATTSEPVKTKPFVTPKIQPLKLTVKSKSSATALDEVLEDVRMSLQKNSEPSKSSLQSPLFIQPVQQSFPQTYANVTKDQKYVQNYPEQRLSKPNLNIHARQSMIDRELEPFLQSLQDMSIQDQPQVQINPDFTQYPYVINGNYQLDPHLLKEKLMDTGLANLEEALSTRSATPAFSPAVTPQGQRYDPLQLQQQFQYYQQQQQIQQQQQQRMQQLQQQQQMQGQQQQQIQKQQQQQQMQHQQQQRMQQLQQQKQQQIQEQQQQQQMQQYLQQQRQKQQQLQQEQQQRLQQQFQQDQLQQQQQNQLKHQKHQQQNSSEAAQICKTMEDLKNLAKEVERKLSQIKYKIVDADESKLDSIILALKNFAPEPIEKTDMPKMESAAEQSERQRKLSGALSELERIYESLSVNDDIEPSSQSKNRLHSDSFKHSQSANNLNSGSRQNVMYADTARFQSRSMTHGSESGMRRNKSDSDCTIKNLRGESLAEVERQTQREFEDINRSFQTLLAEVNQPETPVKSATASSHTAEIEATIDSLLKDLQKAADNRPSSQPVSKSTSSSKLTENLIDDLVNKQLSTQNTCREIRKSEVFTTSSGPFSVLVGINGGGRKPRSPTKNTSTGYERTVIERSYSQPEQDDVFTPNVAEYNISQNKPKNKSSRVLIKMKKDLANRNEKRHFGVRQEDCDSDDSDEGKKIYRRVRRQGNLQHRKSMPADILKKSVETQTFDNYTPVSEIKEKYEVRNKGKSDSAGNESSSSDNYSGENKGPRKRKISKGIAVMMEIFSSSDDERSKQFPLVHSHSAPDLMDLFKSSKSSSRSSKTKRNHTPRFVKQRHDARARKKSSQSSKDDSTDEKIEEFSVTSATSDDGQLSHGSKPPVHPGRKQRSSSPDRVFSDSSRSEIRASNAVKKGSPSEVKDFGKTERRQAVSPPQVVFRKKDKETRDNSPERPHSFHELLAAFEPDPSYLHKHGYMLRKCASADSVTAETMLKKCYHSEPDLREDMPNASENVKDVKLQLEVKIKQ